MKLVEKLSTYAALIGVIGAIGGGFYTWGQFNTRLDTIEKKKFVINRTVDLNPINNKIATLEVELIDRIKDGDTAVEAKIKNPNPNWKIPNANFIGVFGFLFNPPNFVHIQAKGIANSTI